MNFIKYTMQHIRLNQIIIRPLDVESIKNFIRHLISQYEDKSNIQMQASNLFLSYNQWATDNNIVVNLNAISYGIQFRKIKIPHIKRRS